jgi:hypothetical protein
MRVSCCTARLISRPAFVGSRRQLGPLVGRVQGGLGHRGTGATAAGAVHQLTANRADAREQNGGLDVLRGRNPERIEWLREEELEHDGRRHRGDDASSAATDDGGQQQNDHETERDICVLDVIPSGRQSHHGRARDCDGECLAYERVVTHTAF